MEKLKEYLPVITLSLLAFGYTDIASYYYQFRTPIYPYLEFSELFQIQFNFYALNISYILLIAAIAIPFYYLLKQERVIRFYITKIMRLKFFEHLFSNYKITGIIMVIFILVNGTGRFGTYRANKIISGKSRYEVEFISEKDTVKTNNTIAYVGQTKNYIFFYNRKSKQTTVYKVADAKKIKMSEGNDYIKQ